MLTILTILTIVMTVVTVVTNDNSDSSNSSDSNIKKKTSQELQNAAHLLSMCKKCSNQKFCHNLSFWGLSQFEFLRFVTI